MERAETEPAGREVAPRSMNYYTGREDMEKERAWCDQGDEDETTRPTLLSPKHKARHGAGSDSFGACTCGTGRFADKTAAHQDVHDVPE